ncbi:MAG: tRNA guanosine(34) transglycosylase Tgt [Minisyncoccia bacterium]
MSSINFSIVKEKGLMRAGELETKHGKIETPAFVVVGTKASVKALTIEQVKDLGAQVVLANTYHLYLEPGAERVKSFGGLHEFMNWHGPIMTDSGGFQAFSLGRAFGKSVSKVAKGSAEKIVDESVVGNLAEVTEDGVTFKSHLDGSLHHITPEKSMEIQHALGADIIFAFDECTSPQESFEYQEEAMERTHRWATRSLEHHSSLIRANGGIDEPALFGIVQGGREEKLRKRSAEFIGSLAFDGFGIGGSFNKEDMATAVRWVNEILPKEKPRHLLGIGEPEDLFMGVENGVDLFDCVAPTRNGRGGTLYTKEGKINIRNAAFRDDSKPIDEDCVCYTCANYSRGYLCHLYRAHEILGGTLGSIHNLYFIVNLVKKMRQAILEGDFQEFKKDFLSRYKQ